MKVSSVFFISGALVFAIGGALLVRVLASTPPPPAPVVKAAPAPKPVFTSVLAASKDLVPGDFIDNSAVQWLAVDKQYESHSYFLKGVDQVDAVFGATVREPVAKGDVLGSRVVVLPGDAGFIASVLEPGMRAVAIPADAVTSNAGLVSAGDRVDVVLGLKRDQENGGEADPMASIELPKLASQTLLRNVRVLALNDAVEEMAKEKPTEEKSGAKKRKFYETVTLEVFPKDVERLTVAREIGVLQLALRSVRNEMLVGSSDENRIAARDEVTTLGQVTDIYDSFKPRKNAEKSSVVMFRGESKEVSEFAN
jgi:pilus assembly protein CpaB